VASRPPVLKLWRAGERKRETGRDGVQRVSEGGNLSRK
jgi:hypothetical protein